SIRARYFSASDRAVSSPDSIFLPRSSNVASARGNVKDASVSGTGCASAVTGAKPDASATAPPAAPYRKRVRRSRAAVFLFMEALLLAGKFRPGGRGSSVLGRGALPPA